MSWQIWGKASYCYPNGDDDPLEYLTYTNSGSNEQPIAHIGVFRKSGVGKTLEILFILDGSCAFVYSDNLVASDSIFGTGRFWMSLRLVLYVLLIPGMMISNGSPRLARSPSPIPLL